jgi:3',5'-cyclic AMP phosphodiesterase CpdA
MRAMLAQLSDPHIRVGEDDLESARHLEDAVRAVAALDPVPDAVLLSGDVGESGAPAEYERARELLAPLPMPVHAIPGNHDDPDALRAAFPTHGAPYCGPLRLVLCDTTLPGRDDGGLDHDRLDELERTLAADGMTPTIVAMHHLPIVTGVRAMDGLGIPAADRAALAEVVARHANVRLIATGHVHRAMVGRVGPCAVMACPSVYLQLYLDLRPDGDERVGTLHEPPGMAIHLLAGGDVTSHIKPIGDYGPPHHWPS